MRFIHLFFIPAVLLCSCTETQEPRTTTDNLNESVDSTETSSEGDGELTEMIIPEQAVDFFIEDFPKDWLQVELGEKGEYFIQHYCDAEVASIRISPEKGEDWSLYTGWGQDGEIQTLQNFEASSQEIEGVETVSGSFQVYREYDGALTDVSFIWTKDDMICEFVGLNFQSPLFVVESASDMVTHIEEDCEDFWE